MLKEEMLDLVDDEVTRAVAGAVREATDFVAEKIAAGEVNGVLKELKTSIAIKSPCHGNVLGVAGSTQKLLEAVPGVDVKANYDVCCGMAGTYGMKQKNFEKSMKIAEPMIEVFKTADAEEICTTCGTCQIQIQQGTGKEPVHPMSIIARSMGIDP
jgi:glycerol-3-phosphate dehydrogenase subunit C